MSDGHFDRTFLPKTDYRSAYIAGKTAARKLGEQTLCNTLEELQIDPSLANSILSLYKKKMSEK